MSRMIRMKAPEGKTFSFCEIADGYALARPEDVDLFRSHGFEVEGGDAETFDRRALLAKFASFARQAAETWPDEVLRAVVGRSYVEHLAAFEALAKPGEKPAQEAKESVRADEFDGMDRAALFALLKDRGVAVGPATSIEKLRQIARETSAKAA